MAIELGVTKWTIDTEADGALIGSVLVLAVTEETLRAVLRDVAEGADPESMLIGLIAGARPLSDDEGGG